MSKRYYFPNETISDERLPFTIQITTGLTVYYSPSGSRQLFKADKLFCKKTQKLNISINDYNIIVTERKKLTDAQKIKKEIPGFVYKIYYKGVELEKQNDKTD